MKAVDAKDNTVVIGGGIAGLVAAIYVARAGHSVTLMDTSKKFGGRAMTNEKQGAYLNLGVHAFYEGGEGEEVLKELNLCLKGGNPPASAVAVWDEQMHPFPAGPVQLMMSKLYSVKGKMEMVRMMMKLPSLDSTLLQGISLQEWVEREFQCPMVRHALYAVSRSNSFVPHPELLDAGAAVGQLKRTLTGKAFYIDEGWGSLIRQLSDLAARSGVVLVPGTRAEALVLQDGGLRGVRLKDGSVIHTSNAIVCAGPQDLVKLLGEAATPAFIKQIGLATPIKAACLDVVLHDISGKRPSFLAGFWLDQPLFYNNPSTVAKMSNNGSSVVHMIKHLGDSPGDAKADLHQLEKGLDLVWPGWRQYERTRQYLPCITVAHDYRKAAGDAGFGSEVDGVVGLFVAGDWVGTTGMLADASFASAKIAANAVIGRLDHPFEARR
ncbi:phytoene desaturase family protein [Paenibacillus sp. 1P07SE]|uniref:phytoene desaturase family protein n=1 Tax=Paenibacillus sp. 1P07SE TaxID=3132209 RepID=UPI0039A66C78